MCSPYHRLEQVFSILLISYMPILNGLLILYTHFKDYTRVYRGISCYSYAIRKQQLRSIFSFSLISSVQLYGYERMVLISDYNYLLSNQECQRLRQFYAL